MDIDRDGTNDPFCGWSVERVNFRLLGVETSWGALRNRRRLPILAVPCRDFTSASGKKFSYYVNMRRATLHYETGPACRA